MTDPSIIPARPMGLDDILPLIREVGSLRERGEYSVAAELEERIRQPITVAGRVLEPDAGPEWEWWVGSSVASHDRSTILLTASVGWRASLAMYGEPGSGVSISASGTGPTIAAALADARGRYQAAIADTLAVVLPPREPVEAALQVLASLDDERRQTQRRMIAALYWRAGVALAWIRPDSSRDQLRYWQLEASSLAAAARAMEAAL